MKKQTAKGSGYISAPSCVLAVHGLKLATQQAGGSTGDVDGPFAYRAQSGQLLYGAVVEVQVPDGFRPPNGWQLLRA